MGFFNSMDAGYHQDPYRDEELYLQWLIGLADGGIHNGKEYYHLLTNLFHIPYQWKHELDVNRCVDGMDLRAEFVSDILGYNHMRDDEIGCSVLEMLIALAIRIDDILSEDEERSCEFLWELLDNLGLLYLDDSNYYQNDGHQTSYVVIERMMSGNFERNGKGGLFPLKNSRKDQRIRDIWYQLNLYLIENYYADDRIIE